MRGIVCSVLMVRPDQNNWSEYPNIAEEVENHLFDMDWYKVYDLIEAICASYEGYDFSIGEAFEELMNEGFFRLGIGWKMTDGKIMARGDEAFESVAMNSIEALKSKNLPTATSELNEARNDLSRRPEPDLSGVVQHSMSALECVARVVTGDSKATLGQMIKKTSSPIS